MPNNAATSTETLHHIHQVISDGDLKLGRHMLDDYYSNNHEKENVPWRSYHQVCSYYAFANHDYADAIIHCKKACDIAPDRLDIWHNLGVAYYKNNQYAEGLAALSYALQHHYHESLPLLLTISATLSCWVEVKDLLAYYADNHEHIIDTSEAVLLNLAYGLSYVSFDIAERFYDYALTFNPSSPSMLNQYALLLRDNNQCDKALTIYERLERIVPNEPVIKVNKGYAYLTMGDYKQGLALHESRFDTNKVTRIITHDTTPKNAKEWGGLDDSMTGGHLLIYAEQGFGEGIMFSRYLHHILHLPNNIRPDSVALLCQLGLERLFIQSFGRYGFQIIPAHIQLDETGIPFPYTHHVPLMSLPYKLQLHQPISPEKPYITINPEWRNNVTDIFQPIPQKRYKIGLIWQGNPRLHDSQAAYMNIRRSMPLHYLDTLLHHPNVQAYSLQVGAKDNSYDKYEHDGTIVDLGCYSGDFADAATLMSYMDYVISVDTGTCHLAGACGYKTILLNRYDSCWRWGLEGTTTPWYPSMHIIRQHKEHDWQSVSEQLMAMLLPIIEA